MEIYSTVFNEKRNLKGQQDAHQNIVKFLSDVYPNSHAISHHLVKKWIDTFPYQPALIILQYQWIDTCAELCAGRAEFGARDEPQRAQRERVNERWALLGAR